LIAGAPVLVVAGLALAGSKRPYLGGVLVVIGWLFFVLAIHQFGRTGRAKKNDG
jgi:hypothetical protein